MRDAQRVNKNKSLLCIPTAGFVHTIKEKWEGCYLHFDNDADFWVQSGKSVGSESSSPRSSLLNFQRGHEKMVATCGVIDGTTFYLRYLTSYNPNKLKDTKRWEDLLHYVGMAFDCDKSGCLIDRTMEDRILMWTDKVLEGIDRINKGGCCT